MANLGALNVLIGGSFAGLTAAASGAIGQISRLDKAVGKLSLGTALLGGGVIAGLVGGMIAITKNSMDTIDAQYKLAGRLGGTTAAMQTLTIAGQLADVSMEELGQALGVMNARLGEAARTGKGPASEALRNLGLNAKTLAAMDLDQRMIAIAASFERGGYTASQMASSLRELGIRNQNIVMLLQDGGEAIRQAAQDVKDFGIGVSELDASKVEIANDAMTRAKFIFTGIGNQVAVELAPIINLVANWFTDIAKRSGGLGPLIQNVFRSIIVAVSSVIDSFGKWDIYIQQVTNRFQLLKDLMNVEIGAGMFTAIQSAHEKYAARAEELNKKAAAPSISGAALAAYDASLKAFTEKAQENADQRTAIRKRSGAQQSALSQEEMTKEREKFSKLQENIASEDVALKLKYERQLAELESFHTRGIASTAAYEAAKTQLQLQFQQDQKKLIWDNLERDFATDLEQLIFQNEQKQALIKQYADNQTITEQQAAQFRTQLAEKEMVDKLKYYANGWSQIASIVDTSMGHISSLIGEESEKSFSIVKAISVASAVIKGLQAAVNAYEFGTKFGGPALGATLAGVALAGTGAMIAKMMSATPGTKSTGGGGGGGGGGSNSAQQEAAPAQQSQMLIVKGINKNDFFDGDTVRQFSKKLLDHQRDGGRVVEFQ